MNTRLPFFTSLCVVAAFCVSMVLALPSAPAQDDVLEKRASWQPPSPAEVKQQLDEWLSGQELEDSLRQQVDALWSQEDGPSAGSEALQRLAESIALVDDEARQLVQLCRGVAPSTPPPPPAVLSGEGHPPLVRQNLQLLYGRWLAQNRLYDESLTQLADLTPADVVDPASLLFFQAVAHHRLLNKDDCLAKISTLLENEQKLPRRYAAVAKLMQADIQPLKTDSLDEVARLMDDIQRRLDLGRAGKRVRQQEDDVVAKLDKMIEELEKQQQQASASAAASGSAPSSPLQDSTPAGGKGPGNVDPKNVGSKSGWGNLPPKERQEALQQISKDLPAHYREVIEEYFRKIARDSGN